MPSISVVITASPIPSHPSSNRIDSVIDSLKLLKNVDFDLVILAHDAPNPKAPSESIGRYREYLSRLSVKYAEGPYRLFVSPHWGHLSQTLLRAIAEVESEYVLVLQHDLPFVREVDLRDAVGVLNQNKEVKHLRFNKRPNLPAGWDGSDYKFRETPKDRQHFFSEVVLSSGAKIITLTRTLAWADQNFLCERRYIEDVIRPLVGRSKTFPERVINPNSNEKTHELLGTYIWGGFGYPASIEHSDGQERVKSKRVFEAQRLSSLSASRSLGIPRRLTKLKRKFLRGLKVKSKTWNAIWLRRVGAHRMRKLLKSQ